MTKKRTATKYVYGLQVTAPGATEGRLLHAFEIYYPGDGIGVRFKFAAGNLLPIECETSEEAFSMLHQIQRVNTRGNVAHVIHMAAKL